MQRKRFDQSQCAIIRSLDQVGDWWTLLIIRHSLSGIRRFKDFQSTLGMAKNVLADRLKLLVACEILAIVPASDGSKFKEYAPTDKGRGLLPVLVALAQWGEEFLFDPAEARFVVVDRANLKPVEKLILRSIDDRVLEANDLAIPSPL